MRRVVHEQVSLGWHEGEKLYDVGIRAEGTLHNPRGYPGKVVRTAVMAADARKRERRSDASKQAAQTRQYRIRVRVQAARQAREDALAQRTRRRRKLRGARHATWRSRGW